MPRTLALGSKPIPALGLAAAALLLAACNQNAPGMARGFRYDMNQAMRPCEDAIAGVKRAIAGFRADDGRTLNELKAQADASVTACEAGQAAWAGLELPEGVAGPCLEAAEAKVQLAHTVRASLDHGGARRNEARVQQQEAAMNRADWYCSQA